MEGDYPKTLDEPTIVMNSTTTEMLPVAVHLGVQSDFPTVEILPPQTCTILAPQDLPEGFKFSCMVDGIDFIVTVPSGGVRQGQKFEVPHPAHEKEEGSTAVTTTITKPTKWRKGLCDCFNVICNGMFWQSMCCNPILFGQLMTRMKLNACGTPGNPKHTFRVLLITWVCFVGVWILSIFDHIYWFASYPFYVTLVSLQYISIVWWIYMLFVYTGTRYNYRKKYGIAPSTCSCCDGKCDDCICGTCCTRCVAIQMARQTHDEKVHAYKCCTKTGLEKFAPEDPHTTLPDIA